MTPELIGALLPLFVGLPLLVAGLLVISGPRLRLHAVVNFTTMLTMLAAAFSLVCYFWSNDGGAVAHQV